MYSIFLHEYANLTVLDRFDAKTYLTMLAKYYKVTVKKPKETVAENKVGEAKETPALEDSSSANQI